ncbi:craniofacial development protein 2-like protein [Plakobranchus ocellatus]|uniref:Craniofacial development protein 2-like protein n=1 Tax=Plakobranchus ocellatus TaxID=259542 RepID=A0AAV4D503_9GAST|nr:craniofacial development protein 2-like protein [Plakobranchus ocellatus]
MRKFLEQAKVLIRASKRYCRKVEEKDIGKAVKGNWTLSDRIILLKIAGKPLDINIIQVYAPTSACSDDDIEKFYEELEEAKTQCSQQNPLIIMGDFNAKVGEGREENIVGPHGLGTRNMRGEKSLLVVAKLVAKPLNVGIIQVYAPASDSEDVGASDSQVVEVEKFFEEIEKAKGYLKSWEIIFLLSNSRFSIKVTAQYEDFSEVNAWSSVYCMAFGIIFAAVVMVTRRQRILYTSLLGLSQGWSPAISRHSDKTC